MTHNHVGAPATLVAVMTLCSAPVTVYTGSGWYNVTLTHQFFPNKTKRLQVLCKYTSRFFFIRSYRANSSNGTSVGEFKGNCCTIWLFKNDGRHVGTESRVNMTYAKANGHHPPPSKLVKNHNLHVTDLWRPCRGTKLLAKLPSNWVGL